MDGTLDRKLCMMAPKFLEFVGLKLWGLLLDLDWLVQTGILKYFLTILVIYRWVILSIIICIWEYNSFIIGQEIVFAIFSLKIHPLKKIQLIFTCKNKFHSFKLVSTAIWLSLYRAKVIICHKPSLFIGST